MIFLQASKKQSTRNREVPDKAPLEKLQKALVSPTKALPFLSEAADRATDGLHKPIGLVLASAHILGSACLLSGSPGFNCFAMVDAASDMTVLTCHGWDVRCYCCTFH